MSKKNNQMNSKAARRIQSSQDKKEIKGDGGFKSRTTSTAAKRANHK